MNELLKKGLYFDLDTSALKKHYPKGDWHQAYFDIRHYLETHKFEHIQGSGYHSCLPMEETTAMKIAFSMYNFFPWLQSCVSICIISDIPTVYDVSILFALQTEDFQNS